MLRNTARLYNAFDLFGFFECVEKCPETKRPPMHPEVFEWVANELLRYSDQNSIDKPYLRRVAGKWCIHYGHNASDYMKQRGEGVEYGVLSKEEHRVGLGVNGMPQDLDCVALGHQLETDLADLCKQRAALQATWADGAKWSQKFTGRKKAEALIRRIVSPYVNNSMPAVSWMSGWPVSPAVYDPASKTLHLHTWLLENARQQDFVILALHEIVGHFHQENITNASSSAQAENCAMSCEALGEQVMGSRVPEIEWKCMRMCRALLDLRLHTHFGAEKYPTPESVWAVWNRRLGGGFDHIVPLPSETLRVAALPAQALGYIMPSVCPPEGCKGCHSQCTAALHGK